MYLITHRDNPKSVITINVEEYIYRYLYICTYIYIYNVEEYIYKQCGGIKMIILEKKNICKVMVICAFAKMSLTSFVHPPLS